MRSILTILVFSVVLLSSCSKKKCELLPISGLAIDTINIVNKKIPYNADDGSIENLLIKDYYNTYRKSSIKTPTNYRECSHSIGLEYEFNNDILNVRIDKKSEDEYGLSLFNHCFDKNVTIKSVDEEIVFDLNNCEDIGIKKVGLKNLEIIYIIAKDETKWVIN